MFFNNKLTHIRNLFLGGNLDTFEYRDGLLYVSIHKTTGEAVRFNKPYEICVGYNNENDWNCDCPCETREEAWKEIEESLESLAQCIKEVKEDAEAYKRKVLEKYNYISEKQIDAEIKMLKGER